VSDRISDRGAQDDPAPHYAAEDVRGGEIILRKRWERAAFIAGLVGFVILAFVLG
jgi:hypothetical protein